MAEPGPGEVTRLLLSLGGGDHHALEELTPIIYRELRRLAAAYLRRERRDHTLQPTALVHEAYLRLVGQVHIEAHNRGHFFAIASNLMRQILIDHAKRHNASKRGGGKKSDLEEAMAVVQQPQMDLLALDKALRDLAQLDPRQSQVVELRFFGGLTHEQIAEVLAISPVTVKRDWRMAKAFIFKELKGTELDCT